MINLKIGQIDLDQFPGSSIKFALENSMFDVEKVGADYSYPFKLPATPHNQAVLGWGNKLRSTESLAENYQGSICVNESVLFDGTFNIDTAGDDFIEGNFNVRVSQLADIWKDKTLKSFDYGGPRLTGSTEQEYIKHMNDTLAGTMDYVFFPYINSNIIFPSSVVVNDYNVGTNSHQYNTTDSYLHTPAIFVRTVIGYICQESGIINNDTVFTNDELYNLCIFQNNYVEDYGISQIDIKNFLPNISVGEFFTALKNMFNLAIYYENNTLYIYHAKFLLDLSPVSDWSEKVDMKYTVEQVLKEAGFEFEMSHDSTDLGAVEYAKRADNALKRKIRKGSTKITTSATTFFQYNPAGATYPASLMQIEQAANPNNPSLRLIFYRGMQPTNPGGELYPLGTSDNYNDIGDQIGEVWLNWFSVDAGPIQKAGLYEAYWQQWAEYMASAKMVKRRVNLDILDLFNLDMKRQVHIQGRNYFIKSVEVSLPLRKPAVVELLQV